jgi:hypothetical protein
MQANKKTLCSLLVGILSLSTLVVSAQRPETVLTNEDVIKMVKAGLPDNNIVLTIQRFQSDYDVSPDALIRMKKEGVSGSVLTAVQRAEKEKNSKPGGWVPIRIIPTNPKPQTSTTSKVETQQGKKEAEDLERYRIRIKGTGSSESKDQQQGRQNDGLKPVRIYGEQIAIIEDSGRLPKGTTTIFSEGPPVYRIPFKYRIKRFSLPDLREGLDLCAGTMTIGKDAVEIVTDASKSKLGAHCNLNTYSLAKSDIQKLNDTLNSKWYEYKDTADHLYVRFVVGEKNGTGKKKKDFYLYPAEATITYGTRTHTLTGRVIVCPKCPAIVCANCKEDLVAMKNLLDQFYGK